MHLLGSFTHQTCHRGSNVGWPLRSVLQCAPKWSYSGRGEVEFRLASRYGGRLPLVSIARLRVRTFRVSKTMRRFVITAILASLVSSCGSHSRTIIVGREILIPDVQPRVDAIARTRDGGFIITGFGVSAWVIATDSHGSPVWRFSDPIDQTIDTGSPSVPQSEFHGAVSLANGNTLLCGGKYKGGQTQNLLAMLDPNGRLIEKRVQVPNDDPRLIYSNFYQCFPWQDGILLLGNTNDGKHAYIWLVELDADGVLKRQSFVDESPPVAAGSAVGPSFVFTAWDSQDSVRVIRTNEKGETIARRVIAGEFVVQLRSVVETRKTSLLIYRSERATLYTLDEHLQDLVAPKAIKGYFDPQAGRGYVLVDGSIVLFGRSSNATVALIDQRGSTQVSRAFGPQYPSLAVNDAVPVSSDEFVTVRGSVSQDPRDQGLVMSWLTIKEGN